MESTPGPWFVHHVKVVERPVRITEHFAVRPLNGPTFAFLPAGRAEAAVNIQARNACAIAALPDLMAACEAALNGLYGVPGPDLSDHKTREMLCSALAKAKGSST